MAEPSKKKFQYEVIGGETCEEEEHFVRYERLYKYIYCTIAVDFFMIEKRTLWMSVDGSLCVGVCGCVR